MQSSKLTAPSVFARLRAAISSSPSPSDSDISKVIETHLPLMNAQYDAEWASTSVGLKFSDVFAINIKGTNKGKQDDGKWLIQTEFTITAKVNLNDLKDLTPEQRVALAFVRGSFTKGKVVEGPREGMFHMWKDDSGWIAG